MKAKHSPSARAAFRGKGAQVQQVPSFLKGPVERFTALSADPTVREIQDTFAGKNPGKMLLASTSGTISALKTFRETAKSWYVTYYGEGDKEVRISKTDPRRRIFARMEDAEAWATGAA